MKIGLSIVVVLTMMFLSFSYVEKTKENTVLNLKGTAELGIECNGFEIETTIIDKSAGYIFTVSNPEDDGKYEWYYQGRLMEQQIEKGEVSNSSKLYLKSIIADKESEICVKRIDNYCENNLACTTLNVDYSKFFVSSWENIVHSVSDDSVTMTFITYAKKSVNSNYVWTIDGEEVNSGNAEDKMRFTFKDNGIYEVCAHVFAMNSRTTPACETIIIDSL